MSRWACFGEMRRERAQQGQKPRAAGPDVYGLSYWL